MTFGYETSEPSEEPGLPSRYRAVAIGIFASIVALIVGVAVAGEAVWFWLNIMEFGDLFLRPIYFAVVGGLVLSIIAFFRVDFRNRRSFVWWFIRLLMRLLRERGVSEAVPREYYDFKIFRMPWISFLLWQITKVLVGILLFRSVFFGMVVTGQLAGAGIELGSLSRLLPLPFVTPPFDPSYAQSEVIPLLPILTLVVSPILAALATRLTLLVAFTQILRIFTPSVSETEAGQVQLRWRLAVVESLICMGLLWAAATAFFPSFIDYNSKYAIAAYATLGGVFGFFAFRDSGKRGKLLSPTRRGVLMRVIAVIIIVLLFTSVMAVNNSVADARKVEWRGPYTAQQIAVNRHLAELDNIKELPYNFSSPSLSSADIATYTQQHEQLLSKIRLWDWQAAFAKLKPEIGLIPYVDFQDSDILRFNDTLYWSASMKPVMPPTVRAEDQWYAEHLVYTHVPVGFLLLSGNEGQIEPTSTFFEQRRIYYGEGGLLSDTWAAFPLNRDVSDEIDGYFYDGTGGIDIAPPLSWLFEFNFLLAFRDESVHVLRYRDIYERMKLLFPYFEYEFNGKNVDMFPVTDGRNTYYLMPLIVALDTRNVPWSGGNPFMRLVGYALINVYTGEITPIVLGDDYFSRLFKTVYKDVVKTELPPWLRKQTRYPEELFEWRVSMYNFFYVKDPATFIVAKQFFEVPEGLDTYYIIAQPPTFEQPEFLGLLSVELRGAGGRNLAGYMVVRNNYPHLGEMIFYTVSLEAPTKLLGPTAVVEALEKNPEFATLKTLLRTPRIGDKILYRVGDYDVYFIPIYTAGAGGVVAELGAVAAVGATFTGEYFVGLTSGVDHSAKAAFYNFLSTRAVGPPSPAAAKPLVEFPVTVEQRKKQVIDLLTQANASLAQPVRMSPDVTFQEANVTYANAEQWNETMNTVEAFLDEWSTATDRILIWEEDSNLNIGVLANVEGIVELHYVTIRLPAEG